MSGKWASSRRREELPDDWPLLRRKRKEIAGGRCEWVSPSGVRCRREGTDADHWEGRDIHGVEALRWLCDTHHKRKTSEEAFAGRTSKRRKGGRRREDDWPGR